LNLSIEVMSQLLMHVRWSPTLSMDCSC